MVHPYSQLLHSYQMEAEKAEVVVDAKEKESVPPEVLEKKQTDNVSSRKRNREVFEMESVTNDVSPEEADGYDESDSQSETSFEIEITD